MSDTLKILIGKVAEGKSLNQKESKEAFDIIMSGVATAAQIGGFLMSLRLRGETIDEITGAAITMRAKAIKVTAPENAFDIVGTGGDGSGTYNISTTTSLLDPFEARVIRVAILLQMFLPRVHLCRGICIPR